MPEYSGPEDIYKELVEDSDENWLLGLLAFAVVEEQKIEWVKHFQENCGSPPTPQQITEWYQQQPQSILLRAKGTAENALQVFSSEVTDTFAEDYKKEIEQSHVVAEIRELKRFWPQFGVNLAGGFAASFIFAVVLAGFAFVAFNDSSPVQMLKSSEESRDATKE